MKKRVYSGKFWRNWSSRHREKVQRNVKDRLFRFLFANDSEALLQLYNALNGTEYQEASQLQIVTIESAVYVVMKNDLAFVLAGTLNLYEHQSMFSPNLPVRFLIYLAQEYQMLIEQAQESVYGTKRIKLPAPQCVVFYNGRRDMPEEQILRLSDAFGDKKHKSDVELSVRVYNISYGYNRDLLDKYRMLGEYSEFVSIARKYVDEGSDAEAAIRAAIDYCIEHEILADILKRNRSEVLGMLLEEFDVEKYERSLKLEGLEEGICIMVETLQEAGWTEGAVADKIAEKFNLPWVEAKKKAAGYWK